MTLKLIGLVAGSFVLTACTSMVAGQKAEIEQNLETMVGQPSEILTVKLGAPDFDVKLDDKQRALIWDTYKVSETKVVSGPTRGNRMPYEHISETSKGCTILVVVNEMNIIQKWEMRQGKFGCADYEGKLV